MKETDRNFLLQLINNDFKLDSNIYKDDLDWESLQNFAYKHRFFPKFFEAVKNVVPSCALGSMCEKMRVLEDKVSSLRVAIKEMYDCSNTDRIRFLLIKGLALSVIIYDDLYARQINDIDVLIDEYDGIKMDNMMRQLGYVQPYMCDSQSGNMKLLPFLTSHGRDSKHYFEYYKYDQVTSKVEIHRYLTGYKSIINEILWSNTLINIDDIQINTMNLEQTFVYLFINAHNASETNQSLQKKIVLRDYLDIYYFCKKYIEKLDWNLVTSLIRRSESVTRFSVIINNLIDLYHNSEVINRLVELSNVYDIYNMNKKSLVENMNFVERVFFPKERMLSVNKRIKDSFTRKLEKNQYLSIYPYSKTINLDSFIKHNNNANINIKYNISYTLDGLVLSLWLQEQLRQDFDKYLFSFTILNNDYDNHILYSNYEVTYDNDKYVVYGLDTSEIYDPNILRGKCEHYDCDYDYNKESNILHIFVPFSCLGSDPMNNEKTILACVTNFYRHIYDNIYHTFDNQPVFLLRAKPLMFKKNTNVSD